MINKSGSSCTVAYFELSLKIVSGRDQRRWGMVFDPFVTDSDDLFPLGYRFVEVVDVSLRNGHVDDPFLILPILNWRGIFNLWLNFP